MPAGLPGTAAATNTGGNPAAGNFVLMSPLSGPKGSPKDTDNAGNASTGALSTGIGYGSPPVINVLTNSDNANTPAKAIRREGWEDDVIVGAKYSYTPASIAVGDMTMIGGGRSQLVNGTGPNGNGTPAGTQVSVPQPYTAGTLLLGAGQGGNRDAGAGPAFTGFTTKPVTATGTVANGAAVEAGWVNRSGVTIATTDSVLGSASAASAAPA